MSTAEDASGRQSPPPGPGSSSVYVRLISLAWPIVGINVLAVLALAVDTAMCGRLPDSETALTGLGFATQIVFLLMVGMIGLTVGTVATMARAHGAGERQRVDHVLHQSVQLAVLLGLVVAVAGNVVARPLLALLGAEGESLEAGAAYLRPLLLGSVFTYLNVLYAAACRAVGNTRFPLGVAVVQNLLNVLFNYGLILGHYGLPQLGVEGAAIGTVASQAIAACLMVSELRRGALPQLRARVRPAPLDRALVRDLVQVGAPAALDMVVINATFLSIVGMLGRLDPLAVAAHGVGLRIQALAFVPGMSIAQATGAMVGKSLGAGDSAEARRVVRASMVLCVLSMAVLGMCVIGMAEAIVSVFEIPVASKLSQLSVVWMKILGYGLPIVGLYIALVGMLQGSGDTRTSLKINLLGTGLQIPLSWLLGFPLGFGAAGVWIGLPLSAVLKAVLALRVWRKGTWARVGARIDTARLDEERPET